MRKLLILVALTFTAMTVGGCHDSHSTYRLGASADYRWSDDDCDDRGYYRAPPPRDSCAPNYCPPPRPYHYRGRRY